MEPYYTRQDFQLMLVKGVLLPIALIWSQGWLWALCIYFLGFKVYYRVLSLVFKMEALSPLDEFFLLDSPKNRANVVSVIKLEKFKDYPKFRQ